MGDILNSQIIDPKRYKKTTREKSVKKKIARKEELKKEEKIKKKIKENRISRKNKTNLSYIKINEDFFSNSSNVVKKIPKKIYNRKNIKNDLPLLKVCGILVLIVGISVLSKIIVSSYLNKDIVTVNLDTGETATLIQDSILSIGMSKLDTTDLNTTQNIILNEIHSLSNLSLIDFDNSYNIEYKVAEKIEKVTNREYLITLNNDYKINIDDIKKSVDNIKNVGPSNIYYENVSKIEDIVKVEKNVIKVTLSQELPYFVYSLNFPIISENNKKQEYLIKSNLGNEIKFERNNSTSTVEEINFRNYTDIDNMIEDFRNDKIDVFTASSDSIMSLVGKHDYSIKKYRDGETLFLFGNTTSKLFSLKEVRKAILYSIDRDQLIRNINNTFIEKIDIPYIYSDIKYKYDIYGAQNALTSQGWIRNSGIYSKNIDGTVVNLEVNILVNSADYNKVKITEEIKSMLEGNGIKANIKALQGAEFENALNNKEYDLVLATVYINNVPDISFVESYLNVNEIVGSSINIVKNSTIEELPKNINSLMENISSEVACIGICAKNTNVVYQTNIAGISDIGYMNIFNNLTKVGKIQSIDK